MTLSTLHRDIPSSIYPCTFAMLLCDAGRFGNRVPEFRDDVGLTACQILCTVRAKNSCIVTSSHLTTESLATATVQRGTCRRCTASPQFVPSKICRCIIRSNPSPLCPPQPRPLNQQRPHNGLPTVGLKSPTGSDVYGALALHCLQKKKGKQRQNEHRFTCQGLICP